MKKYTSGAFESTTYGIYKSAQDTITSFPASIIANGGNITPWTIYGNMTQSNVCGEKTANLWNGSIGLDNMIFNSNGTPTANNAYAISEYISVEPNTEYIYQFNHSPEGYRTTYSIVEYNSSRQPILPLTLQEITEEGDCDILFTTTENTAYIRINWKKEFDANLMLIQGATPIPYEPYGYTIPVVIGLTSYPIYISEPLRKTLDGSNLYDTISSNGTLTRRADSSGDALETPTTESITVPTLPTSGSAQTFNVDTTLKPSSVELTYTGWHRYDDKKAPWTIAKTRRKKKSV